MSKIVLIGPRGVGKTALSKRLVGEDFFDKYVPTKAANYNQIQLNSIEAGKYQFEFWDLEYNFQTMATFLKGADVVLFVFSLADLKSFELLKSTILNNKSLAPNQTKNKPTYLLIGTNADLATNVSQQDINELSSSHQMKYFKISSKSNYGIEQLFNYIKTKVLEFFKNRVLKCNLLKQTDLLTKETKTKIRLSAAFSECAYLWSMELSNEQNIRNILYDYSQENNGWHLWFSGHANRHHTWRINTIVNRIDRDQFSNVNEIIKVLDTIPLMRSNGALSLRVDFIKSKLGLEIDEQLEDELTEAPSTSCCCGFF